MFCPVCHSEQLIVTNSRPTRGDSQIWRRRKCLSCKSHFTTYEKFDLSFLKISKRSGKKEYFSHSKFYSGIYHAAVAGKKVDRGDASVIAENVTARIEREIIKGGGKEISSAELLKLAVSALKNHHPDILLRYLAYFRGTDKITLKQLTQNLT